MLSIYVYWRLALSSSVFLLTFSSWGQAHETASAPVIQQFIEFRGGYTGGRFSHNSDDYAPSFSLFGGGNSRTGQPVAHRFDGILLGLNFVHEMQRPESKKTVTVMSGVDVLAAADRLVFGDGHQATLPLWAVHPNEGFVLRKRKWMLRGEAGLLLGRVGYFSTDVGGLFSTSTVVDTVRVVPTFRVRQSWANWILVEGGYGTQGLLGLANPVWHAGAGTGFGPRSAVVVSAGTTGAESIDYDEATTGEQYYAQVELAPATGPWRANAFFNFGSGAYGRMALLVAYRLPLRKPKATTAKEL